MSENEISSFCQFYHGAVELIGRRWTGAILRALLAGVRRFSDLTEAIPGLSDRMLSERLKELEAEGIVARTVIPETPVRIEYTLTEKGLALESIVRGLSDWAEKWIGARGGEDEAREAMAPGEGSVDVAAFPLRQ